MPDGRSQAEMSTIDEDQLSVLKVTQGQLVSKVDVEWKESYDCW